MRGTGSDGDADYVLEGFPLLPARLNPIDWKACVSPNPPQVALGFFSTLKIRGALSAELCWERTGGLHSDARQLAAAEDGWRAGRWPETQPQRVPSVSRACTWTVSLGATQLDLETEPRVTRELTSRLLQVK